MSDQMVVRSYRRVFRIDRRIYRVDRWALPVPGGVPLRGVGYFALALLAVVLVERLPLLGGPVGALSAPLRYVVLPLAVAVLSAQAAPDGRAAHRFALGWLARRLRARRTCAGRRVPAEKTRVSWSGAVAVGADERDPTLGPARITGPATVRFAAPVRVTTGRRGRLIARPAAEVGTCVVDLDAEPVVELNADQELEVRP